MKMRFQYFLENLSLFSDNQFKDYLEHFYSVCTDGLISYDFDYKNDFLLLLYKREQRCIAEIISITDRYSFKAELCNFDDIPLDIKFTDYSNVTNIVIMGIKKIYYLQVK